MKIIISLFLSLMICFDVYAVVRNAPSSFNASVDNVLVTGDSILIDANVYYTGVTVGNSVVLREGLSTSSPAFCTVVADTANGNKKCSYIEPFNVDTGIYCDVTLSGGSAGVNLFYQK